VLPMRARSQMQLPMPRPVLCGAYRTWHTNCHHSVNCGEEEVAGAIQRDVSHNCHVYGTLFFVNGSRSRFYFTYPAPEPFKCLSTTKTFT